MSSLVIGGSGKVGGYIVKHLVAAGEMPFALSRQKRSSPGVNWVTGDLRLPLVLPQTDVIYCTASAVLLADALSRIADPRRLKRIVVFTTTSVMTKTDSEVETERKICADFIEAEATIRSFCENHGIGWTILRPTLVYDEGRDRNVSRLASVIRNFGIMPVVSGATGLRQPVHAEDLALAAIAAARMVPAMNAVYVLAGTETITYAEMIGRIFDGLGKRRLLIHVPASIWRLMFKVVSPFFPGFNVAMGMRMSKDMIFDTTSAQRDLDWHPRDFRPRFL